MRIVYIHGRAQKGKSALEIKTVWDAGLIQGYRHAGAAEPFDPTTSEAPFYGDALDVAMSSRAETLERGDPAGQVDPLTLAIVRRMAERGGIDPGTALETDVLERGPERWEWVQALARVIDRRIPGVTREVIGRFTADVSAYLNRLDVRKVVHDIVRPHLTQGPCVVVGHSLGSVVGYSVLAELGDQVDVPLYVTVGSPLGLEEIQIGLEDHHPLVFPAGVKSWRNATDEKDVVALYSALTPSNFIAGIENHTKVKNSGVDPHDITGYLVDPKVAGWIAGAVG